MRVRENAQMDEVKRKATKKGGIRRLRGGGWKKGTTGSKKIEYSQLDSLGYGRKGKRESHCALKRGQKKRASRYGLANGQSCERSVRHL